MGDFVSLKFVLMYVIKHFISILTEFITFMTFLHMIEQIYRLYIYIYIYILICTNIVFVLKRPTYSLDMYQNEIIRLPF